MLPTIAIKGFDWRVDRVVMEFDAALAIGTGLPGVSGVTDSVVPILGGDNWGNSLIIEGFQAVPDTDTNSRYNEVGPGYLRTLGVPLIAGREFTRADATGAPKIAVVNEGFLDRVISVLSAAFACLATLLAAIALYGVLAYTVAQMVCAGLDRGSLV